MTPLSPSIFKRVYIPPSTIISAAKVSTKLTIAIIIFVVVFLLIGIGTCFLCIKTRKARKARRLARKWRLEGEGAESRQLKARLNSRNARFYAPGLDAPGKAGQADMELEELDWREIRRPGKAYFMR